MSTDAKEGVPKGARTSVLTMAEIMEGISDLARNGEGAQRSQAYRLLLSANSGGVALQNPLEAKEVEKRMIRLMRCCGRSMTVRYFRYAFPHAPPIETIEIPIDTGYGLDLPPDFKFPRTCRELYKIFPEEKRHGTPKGFPRGKGSIIQAEWLRDVTLKTLRARRDAQERAQVMAAPPPESTETA